MRSLQNRIARVEAPIRLRWERAWDEFFSEVWHPVSNDVLHAIAHSPSSGERDLSRINAIIRQWQTELDIAPQKASCKWIKDTLTVLYKVHVDKDLGVWPDDLKPAPAFLSEEKKAALMAHVFKQVLSEDRQVQAAAAWVVWIKLISLTIRNRYESFTNQA